MIQAYEAIERLVIIWLIVKDVWYRSEYTVATFGNRSKLQVCVPVSFYLHLVNLDVAALIWKHPDQFWVAWFQMEEPTAKSRP